LLLLVSGEMTTPDKSLVFDKNPYQQGMIKLPERGVK
jgi:hypothetical protein